MEIKFTNRGRTRILQINNARIIRKNFSGEPDEFTREGERHFTLVIPDREIADALVNDINQYGVGWNVKILEPREEGEDPFILMKVKVKFSEYGPDVYLETGDRHTKLEEDTIGCLDKADILSVDMDIRAFDGIAKAGGTPFRAAYLHGMRVVQDINRFAARYAEEEYPEE